MTKSTTHFADEYYKGHPEYLAIRAVFVAIDQLSDGSPVNHILALMNRTKRQVSGDVTNRERLPELVRRALQERGYSLKGLGLGGRNEAV